MVLYLHLALYGLFAREKGRESSRKLHLVRGRHNFMAFGEVEEGDARNTPPDAIHRWTSACNARYIDRLRRIHAPSPNILSKDIQDTMLVTSDRSSALLHGVLV